MTKRLMLFAAVLLAADSLFAGFKEPVFALPVMRTSPKIDGKIDAVEWQDATKTLQFIPLRKDVVFPGSAEVWFGRDKERFYIATKMIVSTYGIIRGADPVKRRGNGGALNAFSGDCFEFDFTSNKDAEKETVSHMIVSTIGAYYSTGSENGLPVSWDPPGFLAASTVENGILSFEYSIPLEEIKFKESEAEHHGVRIARDWKSVYGSAFGVQSSIAPYETSFEKAGACCRMPFVDGAPVVRMEDIGISGHGGDRHFESYPVKLTISNINSKPMDLKVKILGKPVNSQPVLVEMPVTIAAGETKEFSATGAVLSDELVDLEVLVTSPDGKRTWYSRWFKFQPNFEKIPWLPHNAKGPGTEFRHAYYPSNDKMRVRGKFAADKEHGKNAKVTFTILDSKDKVISRSEARANAECIVDTVIPTGDLAAETRASGCGDYRVVMVAEGVEDGVRTNKFWRHVFEWEGNKIGLGGVIPAPFTAVEYGRDGFLGLFGDRHVKVILRDHTLGELDLWKQVNAAGKDLLARPVALVSSTAVDSSRLQSSTEWDVDGMMKWTLTLKPGHYEPMAMEIPVKAERAPLMHSCTDGIRISYAGAVPAGEGLVWKSSQVPHVGIIGDHVPYIWIGGPLRGISVFSDNDKGWVIDKQNHEEILREKDGTVVLRLNLIQKPVDFTEVRTITLGFMATPTKPMQENWRAKSLGAFLGSGKCWGANQTDADVCPWDGTDEFWRKLRETQETGKIDEAFLKRTCDAFPYGGKDEKTKAWWKERVVRHFRSGFSNYKRGGMKGTFTWYTNARGVDFSTPQGHTFCDEWNRQEWMDHNFDILSHRDYDLDPCASFRDYAAWWYKKATDIGVCDNYYWDDIYLDANYNLAGTDAYLLEDGTIQPSVGLFNMRELIRRCAAVQAECGRTWPNLNWLHMTSTAIAPILSFGGVNYDLEDGGSVNDFQDRYGRDYMLACTIGRQHGNIVSVMGYFGKTTPEEAKRLQRCGTGVMIVHELIWRLCPQWRAADEKLRAWGYRTADVDVWNDWDEDVAYPVETSGEPVCSIAMRHKVKNEVLITVSDWAKGGTVTVKPDAATLGLKAGFKAYDFETGAEIPVKDGAVAVTLKKHDFAIIRLSAGEHRH